jgi:hypothetical protein
MELEIFMLSEISQTALVLMGFIYLGRTVVWTQGLSLAGQALCHLSQLPSFFCFSYFADSVSHFWPYLSMASLRPWSSYYTSHIARTTGAHHHSQLINWDGILLTFSLCWPQTLILPISTSWVTGYRHQPWSHTPSLSLFYVFHLFLLCLSVKIYGPQKATYVFTLDPCFLGSKNVQ